MGIPEKIKAIQDEIHRTQLNKATEHHIGLLKAKIAKLKREQEAEQVKKSAKKQDGFDVKRTGDATVVFIGLPSVGKSTLLNAVMAVYTPASPLIWKNGLLRTMPAKAPNTPLPADRFGWFTAKVRPIGQKQANAKMQLKN